MRSRTKPNRLLPVAVSALGAVAILTVAVAGFTGWPPARAIAATTERPTVSAVMLGVDESTAVAIGPEVPIDDKFETHLATATALTGARLLAPAAKRSAKAASGTWRKARASWYGPGLYGNGMAGGGKLKRNSMVVAHRSLPFGTKIEFKYKGRSVTAVVRDRGPFIKGRTFDLGPGTAKALRFSGVGTITYKIIK